MTATTKGTDKQGNRIVIAKKGETFCVVIEKENQKHGRISKSWFLIKGGLTREEAQSIFNKRTS